MDLVRSSPLRCSTSGLVLYFLHLLICKNWKPGCVDLTGGYSKVTGLKLQNSRLKVLLSVGGWNAGSLGFSNMVSTKLRRKTFVESAIKFLRKYNFDGKTNKCLDTL